MGKECTMNFADGVGPVHIGQMVVWNNGQIGNRYRLYMDAVTAIGNKYVTVGTRNKFHRKDGSSTSSYACGSLFSSKEAYDKITKENRAVNRVMTWLRAWENKVTYDQAVKIAEILGIDLEAL